MRNQTSTVQGPMELPQRLYDLVRYCRAELHEQGLISDSEYAEMCGWGSESARRLEDYDELRASTLAPSFCGVAGHFRFQQNGSSCLMCQREARLMRKTWEAGMRLARSYGDNFMYCEGAEKERHWDKLLLSVKLNEEQSAPPVSPKPFSISSTASSSTKEGAAETEFPTDGSE